MRQTHLQIISDYLYNPDGTTNLSIFQKYWKFHKEQPETYNWLYEETKFLQSAGASERLYCVFNNITESHDFLCPVCRQKKVRYNNFSDGYFTTCSKECANSSEWKSAIMQNVMKDPDKLARIRAGSQKGYETRMQKGSYKETGEKTRQRYATMSEEEKRAIYEKSSKSLRSRTKEQRDKTLQLKRVKIEEKRKNGELKKTYDKIVKTKHQVGEDGLTTHKRAGIRSMQTKKSTIHEDGKTTVEKVAEQVTQTKISRYGYGYINLNKAKMTWSEKYGVDNPFKTDYAKQRSLESGDKRLNVVRTNYYHRCVEDYKILNLTIITSLAEFLQDNSNIVDFKCKCGHVFSSSIKSNGMFSSCPSCTPRSSNTSEAENQLYAFVKQYDNFACKGRKDIIKSSSNRGIELDIYSESHKMAIEYDGIKWHSFGISAYSKFDSWQEEKMRRNNHLHKTEECRKLGIKLFHIFSNEFDDPFKKMIWESVIKNSLGVSERIYARNCKVVEVTYKESDVFLSHNHLQGNSTSSVRYGLEYNGELVSLMTFGSSRFDKEIEWELFRFCNKLDLVVVGGASKLLSHFKKYHKPKSIVSYANRRWSDGSLYRKIGFDESGISEPNYFFFKDGDKKLRNRFGFQKHKLHQILDVYDPSLSSDENIYNNGYRKIYDCGNYKFIWREE